MPLGERLQPRSACRRQAALELAAADLLALGGDRLGQACRLQQFRQLFFPECFADALVLCLQPGDVVAVAPTRALGLFAGVASEHLAEQLRAAPAIQQDVVVGVDQVVALFVHTHQDQPQQGRLLQLETPPAFARGQLVESLGERFATTPVMLGERQFEVFVDHLERLLQIALPEEAGAQDVMTVQRRLPGGAEARGIESMDVDPELVQVIAGSLLVERVEQHAVLHRRQRVDVLDPRQRQAIQLLLAQRREGEVRRRGADVALLAAMLDQRVQLPRVVIDQALDGRLGEHFPAEAPVQAQLATVDLAFDAQPVGQRGARILGGAGAFRGRYQQRRPIELAVEPAQVIEGDPRLRQRGQAGRSLLSSQVAQQAVADALVRHAAQLLLDRLQRLAEVRGRGQAQREQAGEPAHRAAQVDGLAEVLAAVPFELHQHAGVAAPAAGRAGQGGQQQVVDLSPVGRRGFLQQLPGTLGVQGQDELALMAVFQGSVRVFAWQRMRSVVQLRLPVVEFVQARAGLFVQVPAPGLVGTATRPEIGVEVGIETLQVFQQDAPGHPVHRQVVDDQQQALAAVGHVHQQRTQQRPLFEVEAALGFFAKRQQRLLGPRLPAPQRLAGLLGVGLVPGAALFAETQAQGIVLRLQAFQGTPQPVAVERLARLQQERLVPVLAVGNRPLEEPALYRRQRHLAACRPLFRRRRTRLGRQGQAADVLVLEQVARAQLQSGLARTADYLDRDDRVAAEAEEVVVQADPLDAQQVLPDFRQGSLHCVARCAVACLRHAYFRRR